MHCDYDEWSLVADDDSDITNFGDSTNSHISMILANGSFLYVGFDNSDGVQIYKTDTADPGSDPSIWEPVGDVGLGNPDNVKEIYSAISIQQGLDYYIYVSAGNGGTPVSIFRNRND